MITEQGKISFTATPDVEALLDEAKVLFPDYTQSEMLRTLIIAGLAASKEKSAESKIGGYVNGRT